MTIGILYICTGEYIQFFDDFYSSAKKFLFPDTDKHFFVYTSNTSKIPDIKDITKIEVPSEPWPLPTLKRFHYFLQAENEISKCDYLIFFNANIVFLQKVTKNFIKYDIKPLFVTEHPFRQNLEKSTEHNPLSHGYIEKLEYDYICGGLFGGKTNEFIDMCKTLREWAQADMENNTIPIWHDESLLNRYVIENRKSFLILPRKTLMLNNEGTKVQQLFEKKIYLKQKSKYGIKKPTD